MSSQDRAVMLALYDELEQQLDAFNQTWPEHLRHAELYRLPVLNEQRVPDRIEPERLVGDSAERLARLAFRAFQREPDQHPATVVRYPGVVVLRENIFAEIQRINALKDTLRSIVAKHPPGTRAVITRKTFPGRVMLQVYRRIHVAENVRRVLWTWAGHTTGHRSVTVEKAAEEIEASRSYPPEHISREEWDAVIDIELETLSTLPPSAKLLYRRRIAPHPRVSIYVHNQQSAAAVYHGNLPLVIYTPENEPLPEITPLSDYVEGVRTAPRRDRRPLIPVIERLHLYMRPSR